MFFSCLVVSRLMGKPSADAWQCVAGAASSSTAVANLAGSLAVLLSTLFGGFLLSRKQMPPVVSWLTRLSFVRQASPPLCTSQQICNSPAGQCSAACYTGWGALTPCVPCVGDAYTLRGALFGNCALLGVWSPSVAGPGALSSTEHSFSHLSIALHHVVSFCNFRPGKLL